MSLLYYCRHCGHPIDWTDSPPPWCPRCGGDFKPGGSLQPALAATASPEPSAPPAPPPPPSVEQEEKPRPETVLGVPLWPKGPHNWGVLIGVAVAAVLGPFAFKLIQKSDDLQEFNALRTTWLEKPVLADPSARYVRGKVLPYGLLNDGNGANVDRELYRGLPKELRPNTPDEVETLAWVEWTTVPITTPRVAWQMYHILGYQYVCKLTLIDRRQSKKLATVTFQGSDPTRGFRDSNGHGDKPYSDVIDYLRTLPRQAD